MILVVIAIAISGKKYLCLSFPAVMVIFMPFTAVISASASTTLNILTGN
jgi:hypothetical protein